MNREPSQTPQRRGVAVKLARGVVAAALADQGERVLIFDYDADAALARVKAMASIKTVSIRKIYPGQLAVNVTERVPMARCTLRT